MTIPAGRVTRSRHSFAMTICGLAAVAVAVLMLASLVSASWTWWVERDYVLVKAQLYVGHVKDSGAWEGVSSEYGYRYAGRDYIGTKVGGENSRTVAENESLRMQRAHESGTPVTAWVDPERPQDATLYRDFNWPFAIFLAVCSGFLVALGAAVFTTRFWLGTPARGSLIAADHGAYLYVSALATWCNLAALALVIPAMADMQHGVHVAPILALLFCVAGFALASKGWQLYERRWLLGFPVLERLDDGSGKFTFRIHFDPPLGKRTDPLQMMFRVGVQIKKQRFVTQFNKRMLETVWEGDFDQPDVQRGAATMDVCVDAPAWPDASRDGPRAHWLVRVRVLDNHLKFYLAPQQQV